MIIANIFGPDLGYVVIIVLAVMVGGSQLPKIARNIGTAGKEFRKAQREAEEEEAQHQQVAQAQPAVQTAPPGPAAVSAAGTFAPENQTSLSISQGELDALLKAREEQVRRESTG